MVTLHQTNQPTRQTDKVRKQFCRVKTVHEVLTVDLNCTELQCCLNI